jgi:hypothetical protein
MACFNCFKWLSCCGLCCGVISSVSEICRGVKAVKEEVIETIENKFHPKHIFYLHKDKDLYQDLSDKEIVQLTFFKESKNESVELI